MAHLRCDTVTLINEQIPETEGGANWFVKRHDRTKGPDSNTLRLLHVSLASPGLISSKIGPSNLLYSIRLFLLLQHMTPPLISALVLIATTVA